MGKYIGPDCSIVDSLAFFCLYWIIFTILGGIQGNMWKVLKSIIFGIFEKPITQSMECLFTVQKQLI